MECVRPAVFPDRLLRIAEVRELTSLSTATIYRKIAAGTFPPGIKLGERATAWLESDVTAWIAARVAESRAKRIANGTSALGGATSVAA